MNVRLNPDSFFRGLIIPALVGITCAVVIMSLHGLLGSVHWFTMSGYILIGCSMATSFWISEKIWRHSFSSLVYDRSSFLIQGARLPLWYLAGGMGYIAGMVIAKKFGLMEFYDTPLRPIFDYGARAGTLVQMVFVMFINRWIHRFVYS